MARFETDCHGPSIFEAGRENVHLVGVEVAVPVEGELRAAVSQLGLDGLDRGTVGDEKAGARVAEGVEGGRCGVDREKGAPDRTGALDDGRRLDHAA